MLAVGVRVVLGCVVRVRSCVVRVVRMRRVRRVLPPRDRAAAGSHVADAAMFRQGMGLLLQQQAEYNFKAPLKPLNQLLRSMLLLHGILLKKYDK